MADLTISGNNVAPGANARIRRVLSAEAIDAGEVIYLNSSGKALKAEASNTQTEAVAVGISLVQVYGADQMLTYVMEDDDLDLGITSAWSAGHILVLSHTAGKIKPVADVASGDFGQMIGWPNGSGNWIVLFNSFTQSGAFAP